MTPDSAPPVGLPGQQTTMLPLVLYALSLIVYLVLPGFNRYD